MVQPAPYGAWYLQASGSCLKTIKSSPFMNAPFLRGAIQHHGSSHADVVTPALQLYLDSLPCCNWFQVMDIFGFLLYVSWLSQNAACPSYWESPMGNAKLHRILRFRMGSHQLPVEEGRHFNLPRASRVCNLCSADALGDERHMLLECPALADLRLQFSSLLLPCSSVMRRLLWASMRSVDIS